MRIRKRLRRRFGLRLRRLRKQHELPSSSETTWTNVLITFYGYDDNTASDGGYGGADISYPGQGPQQHQIAHEGSGTYSDPITFAGAAKLIAPGTIIYVPGVQKYYIMEDDCAQCDIDAKSGKKHVDLWMGPNQSTGGNVMCCENALTGNVGSTIIVHPSPGHPVQTASLYTASCVQAGIAQNRQCASQQTG
ncbi:unnamed protein product (mitochondrion) [Plasmodiophora brassicae]|uniref:Uncharacterized protein n=1 Tax=Plasmodiophora brassicae TaxID=37360 RepID=A0A3P3YPK9_PLABS|nr:unnamed protein product [Plasmodiophora brassicae]